MMQELGYTPDLSRARLLAALSAIGAAATGIAEHLKQKTAAEQDLAAGLAWSGDANALLPLGEEAVEPLVDALRCVFHAVGYPAPYHRIGAALDRFSDGFDD
ncbi:hypothetical protein [Brevundimonas nasdae]|uniref:hypothetical protein n=1 Tax=Brevundimonas nasdae TaxID=172043 RepID=UPI003F693233